jgi:hypothetical protein
MLLLLAFILCVIAIIGFVLLLVFGPLFDWVPDVVYSLLKKRRDGSGTLEDGAQTVSKTRPPPLEKK